MADPITLDDLFAAYRDAGFTTDAGNEGASREELRRMWNCGAVRATQYLKMAKDAGILRIGWRLTQDISGRNNRIPVYSFVTPPKRQKRAKPK